MIRRDTNSMASPEKSIILMIEETALVELIKRERDSMLRKSRWSTERREKNKLKVPNLLRSNKISHTEKEEKTEAQEEVVREDTQEVVTDNKKKKRKTARRTLTRHQPKKVLSKSKRMTEEEEGKMSQLLKRKNQQDLLLKNSRLNKDPNKPT